MAGIGAKQLFCVGLLFTTAVVLVQHTCSARPLQQKEVAPAAAAEGSGGGLLHAVAAVQVHVDAAGAAAAFGNGAGATQDQGGDAAADDIAAVPYENKRLSPGGPDPQHH